MRVRVVHNIDDLANDLASIAVRAPADFVRVVRSNAWQGRDYARRFARSSAGRHGKHYHRAITAEQLGPMEWEYGPDPSRPQGGMSFERGSRNQPAHLDLAKSHDIIGREYVGDVRDLLDGYFW